MTGPTLTLEEIEALERMREDANGLCALAEAMCDSEHDEMAAKAHGDFMFQMDRHAPALLRAARILAEPDEWHPCAAHTHGVGCSWPDDTHTACDDCGACMECSARIAAGRE